MAANTQRGIGTFGSTALLVSSMTGPGLSTIPAMFQQSGWVAPVFVFVIVGFLSGCAALFVCEAMSSIRGNEKFQAKVELTTIAQIYLGKKYHYFFQIMLFLALQSVNVTSIILSAQTIDGMLVNLFHGTCGLGVHPSGWFCATTLDSPGNSVFPSDSYFLFTFGFIVTGFLVIPLGFFSLVENIIVQIASFIALVIILIMWIVSFGRQGLDPDLLPAWGPDVSIMLGIVIFNFSYITTIPSWVNSLKPDVSIHKCIWVSVVISAIFYLLIGTFGAMAYQMNPQSDILSILGASGDTMSLVSTYVFPLAALVTSIPVFTIVIRSNLLRGRICSRGWAILFSNFLPWFVCIPLQTSNLVGTIQNWSSLFFQSTVNFILPFALYFVSRRLEASVELPSDEKPPPSTREEGPDNIIMYNPEENRSISIRRSNYSHSRTSRFEQSVTSPPWVAPPSHRTPLEVLEIPTIVLSGTDTDNPSSPQVLTSTSVPGSPKRSGSLKHNVDSLSPSPKTNAASLNTCYDTDQSIPTTNTGGLGISQPPMVHVSEHSDPPSSPVDSTRNQLSPSIIQIPPSPRSGRSTSFAFTPSILSGERMSTGLPNETVCDAAQEPQERFRAFKARPWLNPFYLAITASGLLSISIVFMIIYDVTMSATGNSVF